MQKIIDLNSVEICLIKPDEDDFSKLDCRENDGNDPLRVQDYLANKALDYLEGKVSAIYVVKQNERILAFSTLSMTGLEYYRLGGDDKLPYYTPKSYPAVRLGYMGVDKNSRGQGLGQLICDFCIGRALILSKQIACRYIVLDTNEDKAGYYENKCGFKKSGKTSSNGNVSMYKRLLLVRSVNETVGISESVIVMKTTVQNKKDEGEEQAKENK